MGDHNTDFKQKKKDFMSIHNELLTEISNQHKEM